MGKYLKTPIDIDMTNQFASEVLRMDFDNPVLKNMVLMLCFQCTQRRKTNEKICCNNLCYC